MMSQKIQQKRYSLFILAILLFLSGGAALVIGSNNFAIRSVGIVAFIGGTYLVRISNVHTRSASLLAGPGQEAFKEGNGPGRLAWAVGWASLAMLGLSFFFLNSDALHGGRTAWPVYLFAGVGVACAIVWGYIAASLFSRGR